MGNVAVDSKRSLQLTSARLSTGLPTRYILRFTPFTWAGFPAWDRYTIEKARVTEPNPTALLTKTEVNYVPVMSDTFHSYRSGLFHGPGSICAGEPVPRRRRLGEISRWIASRRDRSITSRWLWFHSCSEARILLRDSTVTLDTKSGSSQTQLFISFAARRELRFHVKRPIEAISFC